MAAVNEAWTQKTSKSEQQITVEKASMSKKKGKKKENDLKTRSKIGRRVTIGFTAYSQDNNVYHVYLSVHVPVVI